MDKRKILIIIACVFCAVAVIFVSVAEFGGYYLNGPSRADIENAVKNFYADRKGPRLDTTGPNNIFPSVATYPALGGDVTEVRIVKREKRYNDPLTGLLLYPVRLFVLGTNGQGECDFHLVLDDEGRWIVRQ